MEPKYLKILKDFDKEVLIEINLHKDKLCPQIHYLVDIIRKNHMTIAEKDKQI